MTIPHAWHPKEFVQKIGNVLCQPKGPKARSRLEYAASGPAHRTHSGRAGLPRMRATTTQITATATPTATDTFNQRGTPPSFVVHAKCIALESKVPIDLHPCPCL